MHPYYQYFTLFTSLLLMGAGANAAQLSSIYPYNDSMIDEDAVFALEFDQKMQTPSIEAKAFCLIDGVGEKIPVRVLSEQESIALFNGPLAWFGNNDKTSLVQCTRELPTDTKVSLVFPEGIESNANESTDTLVRYTYRVRPPFSAKVSCERINTKSQCSPLGDVIVTFSSVVPADALKKGVKLTVDGKTLEPTKKQEENLLDTLVFKGPFTPQTTIKVEIDPALTDEINRPLHNSKAFPIALKFDDYPPLLKFATGDFGIIESYAHTTPGASLKKTPALIPLTVRHVENVFSTEKNKTAGVRSLRSQNDAEVRRWLALLPRLSEGTNSSEYVKDLLQEYGVPFTSTEKTIDVRNLSLLSKEKAMKLPKLKNENQDSVVVGLPVNAPGFYVFEAESPALGASLTEQGKPMYVRTATLVTNMAVHLKTSDKGALVWVTRLDDAKVIPNVNIRLSECDNKEIALGKTNEQGVFEYKGNLSASSSCYMASAKMPKNHPMSYGVEDYSFAFAHWTQGIEPWQFNIDHMSYWDTPKAETVLIHPVLSRSLLRAGETLHIKHLARFRAEKGLVPPALDALPEKFNLSLVALDETIELPLVWTTTPNGSVYAETVWEVPKTVKNGVYHINYEDDNALMASSEVKFQVEDFKLPLLTGNIKLSSEKQVGSFLISPTRLQADIQLNYLSGGAAVELPIEVSAMYLPSTFSVPDLPDVSFTDVHHANDVRKVFLDKKKIVLDNYGHALVSIDNVPVIQGKGDLLVEVSFTDPNGQIQTISHVVSALSSPLLTGLRHPAYFEPKKAFPVEIFTVNAEGQRQANIPVKLHASRTIYNVVRKRLVGGFYTYDTHERQEDLGEICQGTSNEEGIFRCEVTLEEGELNLVASVNDGTNASYETMSSVWVFEGASWYTGNDTDRVDVVADKKAYQVGEEAVFNVKLPFEQATALIAVERENIVDYQLAHFDQQSSSFRLKIKEEWAPNVFVSVLSVRGRLRGDKNEQGMLWINDEKQSRGASMLVDLAKPSFRFGVSKILVQNPQTLLDLSLKLDKSVYQVREKAQLSIEAKTSTGDSAKKANVAVFVVDKALLELAENKTSEVLSAMYPERPWGVSTATAQGEVVGRRHYGRKAIPAGGGGGLSATRELFDALVFWKANVVLDEQGKANVSIPLNDSISQFEVVVVADDGMSAFGTQKINYTSHKDLQVISGLPLLVRDTDKFEALVTLQNSTDKNLDVLVKGTAKAGASTLLSLEEKKVTLAAGRSTQVSWQVDMSTVGALEQGQEIKWYFEVKTPQESKVLEDKIVVKQQLIPTVPMTTRQVQLVRMDADKPVELTLAAPIRAKTIKDQLQAHVQVQMSPHLGASLEGVTRFFREYPFVCLEQQASKAMGLGNESAWSALMQGIGAYVDEVGFLRYYPSMNLQGSPLLTAYVLAISADARGLGWDFALPEALQEKMIEALVSLVNGQRKNNADWIENARVRDYQLTLLASLARYNLVTETMLDAYPLDKHYSVPALLNLYIIHRHLPSVEQEKRLALIREALLSNMESQGDRLVFKEASKLDDLWWLMENSQTLQAKLIYHTAHDKAWSQEAMPLMQGLIGQQSSQGHWGMTTANLWGTLAVKAFNTQESTGTVQMVLSGAGYEEPQTWDALSLHQKVQMPWLAKKDATLRVNLMGEGTAWATVSRLAMVEPVENTYAGYRVEKVIEPVSRRIDGQWSVGDVYRVKLKINASSRMAWVVLSDPIPSGATILGTHLGRSSQIAQEATEEERPDWVEEPAFIERKADMFRAYYHLLDEGEIELSYLVRLNTVGKFSLPPTRVEAMYVPSLFGETVNPSISVK